MLKGCTIEAQYHPKGAMSKGAAYAVVSHELGHALEGRIENLMKAAGVDTTEKRKKRYFISGRIRDKALSNLSLQNDPAIIKGALSGYANRDSAEFFAEAVSESGRTYIIFNKTSLTH